MRNKREGLGREMTAQTVIGDGKPETLDPVARLEKTMREVAKGMDRPTGRILVRQYYQYQKDRIAFGNQVSALAAANRDTAIVSHFYEQTFALEKQMAAILKEWASNHPVGMWAMEQKGIGPILSSAFLAYIDMDHTPHQSSLWSLAGYNPDVVWVSGADVRKIVQGIEEKWDVEHIGQDDVLDLPTLAGLLAEKLHRNAATLALAEDREDLIRRASKRPWSAPLKIACWKAGDSFVKVSGKEDAYYGKKYKVRKAYEVARNERGGNAEYAAKALATRPIRDKKLRATLETGKLPPGQLELRARRWAVKLFLAHWFEIAYEHHFGEPAPMPYPIAYGGHAEWEKAPR
jgi:hypothetical protein